MKIQLKLCDMNPNVSGGNIVFRLRVMGASVFWLEPDVFVTFHGDIERCQDIMEVAKEWYACQIVFIEGGGENGKEEIRPECTGKPPSVVAS